MAEPNVLLLDEPTNDLDIDTLQELESLLDTWPGTLVVISHDRYLIERIADNTYALFGDGKLTNLPGGIEEYLRRRKASEDAAAKPVLNLGEKEAQTGANSAEVAAPKLSNQEVRDITKKMNSLERKMSKLDEQISTINSDMAAAAEAMDTSKLQELDSKLKQLQGEHEQLEMDWLELGEKLE